MVAGPRIEKALYERLSGDFVLLAALAEIGAAPDADQIVYAHLPPLDVPPPFVLLSLQSSVMDSGPCGSAQVGRLRYLVKLIAAGDDVQAALPVLDRIAALLGESWRGSEGGLRISCNALEEVCYVEGSGAGAFLHVGCVWEVVAR